LEKGYTKEILEKSGLSIFLKILQVALTVSVKGLFSRFTVFRKSFRFGARILKSNVKTAKYLNSPETEIYHKSNVLYGLNQSKQAISRKNGCLLVEGYMDVISLHMSGIKCGGKFGNFPDHRADQTDQEAYGKRNDPVRWR
jgi:DNA primase